MSTQNYVHAFLNRAGVLQKDVAHVIGVCPTTFTKIISGGRPAPLSIALALEVAFGTPPSKLFPGLFETVQDAVIGRCGQLSIALEDRDDVEAQRLLRFIDQIKDRVDDTPAV